MRLKGPGHNPNNNTQTIAKKNYLFIKKIALFSISIFTVTNKVLEFSYPLTFSLRQKQNTRLKCAMSCKEKSKAMCSNADKAQLCRKAKELMR